MSTSDDVEYQTRLIGSRGIVLRDTARPVLPIQGNWWKLECFGRVIDIDAFAGRHDLISRYNSEISRQFRNLPYYT